MSDVELPCMAAMHRAAVLADSLPDHPLNRYGESLWERCAGCGREYRYPHLCREHALCGRCHPPVEVAT